jgi:predicted DNA-binding protein
MANSKAISIRVPDELLEKIDLLAEKKYKSHKGTPNRSLVVLDAIVAYFDTLSDTGSFKNAALVSDSVSIQEFRDLQILFGTLSDSVVRLEKRINTLSDNVEQIGEVKILPIQLSTLDTHVVSDSVNETSILNLDNGLTVSQLGSRLKQTPQLIGTNKKKPKEFSDWAKEKDPDRYGWEYKESSKLYYPIKPLA